MTKVLLITSDTTIIDAVRATGVDLTVHANLGYAAGRGALDDTDVVLYGHDVLVRVAPLGTPDGITCIAAVFTAPATNAQTILAGMAGATRHLVLSDADGGLKWLHARAV